MGQEREGLEHKPRVITLAGAKVNDTTDTCCGEHVSVSESLTRQLPASE
jgi:hypothetical protein